MKTSKTAYKLHEEQSSWLSKLAFYRDELGIMKNRLDYIARRNNEKQVLTMLQQFQNQVMVQSEQIAILAHQIKQHKVIPEGSENDQPDEDRFDDHAVQRLKMEIFEKLFIELKQELVSFVSKWV
jgi:hypothetical protein